MSPTQRTLGAGAVKSRFSRSGNGLFFLSCRVRFTRRFFVRATSCCRAIDSATVLTLTRQPSAASSAWIRGEP